MGVPAPSWRSFATFAAALTIFMPGTAALAAPAALVAAYSFDAGTGSLVRDVSGKGHDGTISGAAWMSSGRHGGALSFDGVNDLVTVADASALDLDSGMTLSAWVRPTANESWRTIVTKETNRSLVYGLFSNSDTARPSGVLTIGKNQRQKIVRGASVLPVSTWTHLATTYDGANLRLFVNGTQVARRAVTGQIGTSTGPLQIGGNNVWSEWFQGQLDDLRIYNRALTASELKTDMNTPAAPAPVEGTTAPTAPTAPTGLTVAGKTETSLTLSWNASTDNTDIAGYRLYRNGVPVDSTTGATYYTFTNLTCSTPYALAVDAVDVAGNASTAATTNTSTTECSLAVPSASANLWIDTTGGSCTRTTTPSGYADVDACGTFDAAYDRAACGDVIRIKGGTYGGQNVTGQRSCSGTWDAVTCSSCVQVLEASGERVVLSGSLTSNLDYAVFEGIEASNWNVTASGVDHVMCRNCDVNGVFFSGTPISHLSMIGGDVGPMVNAHPQLAPAAGNGAGWMTDVLFQGVNFHDVTTTNAASYHVECMQVAGGTRITFRANRWSNCGIFGLSITEYNNSGPPTDFLVENNFFGPSINGGYYSFHVNSNASAIVRLVLQYNSSPQPFLVKNVVQHQNSIVRGNLAPRPACDAPGTITYDNNVWTGGTCAGSDLSIGSLGFVNQGAWDYHIPDGHPAEGNGSATCPARDYDGEARPVPSGATCDAGADERS